MEQPALDGVLKGALGAHSGSVPSLRIFMYPS